MVSCLCFNGLKLVYPKEICSKSMLNITMLEIFFLNIFDCYLSLKDIKKTERKVTIQICPIRENLGMFMWQCP